MVVKIASIIEEIRNKEGWSKARLGRAVHIEAPEDNKSYPTDVINKRLKQKDMTVGMAEEMIRAMGYKMVIVPEGVTVKSDWYEVGGDDNE